MKGKLIIFSAPSGSGKTTIVKHLLSLDMGLEFSISATSRKPRGNEEDGVDYYFLDPDEFRKKIAASEFLEWEEVYPNQFYGTLKSDVERITGEGKHVLFDIDVIGGMNLKKEFGERARSFFVKPPSIETMEERLRKRGTDSEDQLKIRLNKAAHEMTFATQFDHTIINDQLDTALAEAERLVRQFIGP